MSYAWHNPGVAIGYGGRLDDVYNGQAVIADASADPTMDSYSFGTLSSWCFGGTTPNNVLITSPSDAAGQYSAGWRVNQSSQAMGRDIFDGTSFAATEQCIFNRTGQTDDQGPTAILNKLHNDRSSLMINGSCRVVLPGGNVDIEVTDESSGWVCQVSFSDVFTNVLINPNLTSFYYIFGCNYISFTS